MPCCDRPNPRLIGVAQCDRFEMRLAAIVWTQCRNCRRQMSRLIHPENDRAAPVEPTLVIASRPIIGPGCCGFEMDWEGRKAIGERDRRKMYDQWRCSRCGRTQRNSAKE